MISIYPKKGAHSSVTLFQPCNLLRFSQIKDLISAYTWSPIIYANNYRLEDNFISSRVIGLDFDEGLTLNQAVDNVFCDMRHIIGTTRSHQKDKNGLICDRFRVILQFDGMITDLRTYKWNIQRLVSHYESDQNAKGASRLFFPCLDIVSAGDGYLVDIEKPPEWFMDNSAREAELAAYAKLGDLPFWLKRNLAGTVLEGNRNSAVFGMAKDLAKIKFDRSFVESHLLNSQVYQDNVNDKDFIRGFNATINGIFRRGMR